MMFDFIARFVGQRWAMPVFFGIMGALLLAVVVILAKCGGVDRTAERQAEQTSRSGEAIAGAAKEAIETIGDRNATEGDIDRAIDQANEAVGNAGNPDDLRRAVVDGLCKQKTHRDDTACRMR